MVSVSRKRSLTRNADTVNRTDRIYASNKPIQIRKDGSRCGAKKHIRKFQPPLQIFCHSTAFHHRHSLFMYLWDMPKAPVTYHTPRSISRWYKTTAKHWVSVIWTKLEAPLHVKQMVFGVLHSRTTFLVSDWTSQCQKRYIKVRKGIKIWRQHSVSKQGNRYCRNRHRSVPHGMWSR